MHASGSHSCRLVFYNGQEKGKQAHLSQVKNNQAQIRKNTNTLHSIQRTLRSKKKCCFVASISSSFAGSGRTPLAKWKDQKSHDLNKKTSIWPTSQFDHIIVAFNFISKPFYGRVLGFLVFAWKCECCPISCQYICVYLSKSFAIRKFIKKGER